MRHGMQPTRTRGESHRVEVQRQTLLSRSRHLGTTDGRTDVTEYKADALYDWETRHYLHYAKSWRNIPKPSIAAVQGKCIAAGLMLCWPCDLIVAAENAEFSDPVLHMGISASSCMLTRGSSARARPRSCCSPPAPSPQSKAEQLGMVNKVVPLDDSCPPPWRWRAASRVWIHSRCAWRSERSTTRMDIQGYTTRSTRASTCTTSATHAPRSSPGACPR